MKRTDRIIRRTERRFLPSEIKFFAVGFVSRKIPIITGSRDILRSRGVPLIVMLAGKGTFSSSKRSRWIIC